MADTSRMKVTAKTFTLKEIASGYQEDAITNSVVGMDGRLDIRPKYQREFRYPKDKQDKLIQSVLSNYPISIMYWVQIGTDANGDARYEVLDGQQRLISLCRFMTQGNTVPYGDDIVSYDGSPEMIDNYDKLTIYVCEKGSTQTDESFEKEKLAWFETINIAGATLTPQEIRSALKYSDWCTSAKSHFVYKSNTGTTANSYGVQRKNRANDYLNVKNAEKNDKDKANEKANSDSYQTQEIFEKVLRWITGSGLKLGSDEDVLTYMEIHRNSQKYPDASELWDYFKSVMNWVWEIFEDDANGNDITGQRYDSNMKNVDWGVLYNQYHDKLNALSHADYEKAKQSIRDRIDALLGFEVSQTGKYQYVLDEVLNGADNADKSVLSLRAFSPKIKQKMYLKQHGICPACGCHFSDIADMEGDHIKAWSDGGFTDEDNCQMLCADCNGAKLANAHFGQKYSRDAVIAFTQAEIDACPEGVLNVNR